MCSVKMDKIQLLTIILVGFAGELTKSAKILGAVFTPSYSHQVVFRPIWRELSLRGHQVTLLTTNPVNDPSLINLTEIDLSMSYDILNSYNASNLLNAHNTSVFERFGRYVVALNDVADKQFSHPDVQKLIHNKSEHFDLLMIESMFPTQMAFAKRFNAPFIGLTPTDAPARIHRSLGNPSNPIGYPEHLLPTEVNMDFRERLLTILGTVMLYLYENYQFYPEQDLLVKKHFGDGYPSLFDIQRNMSMLFINSNPIFSKIRPLLPNTIQFGGGIHLQEPEPLPPKLKQYLDEAKDGFIYFSLGSNVKSAELPEHLRMAVMGALSELPFKVLWKLEDESIAAPSNTKVLKWVPQLGVLKHPNIKGFVTQCGLQSMEEAIFNQVPMVGLPFYGDQFQNSNVLKRTKIGIKLGVQALEKDDLKNAILEIATNSEYKRNVKALYELYKDEQLSGLERAIWWTEYVIRHKGVKHLQSSARDLEFYKYYCLDIIALFCTITFVFLYICLKLTNLIFRGLICKMKLKNE